MTSIKVGKYLITWPGLKYIRYIDGSDKGELIFAFIDGTQITRDTPKLTNEEVAVLFDYIERGYDVIDVDKILDHILETREIDE